MLGVPFVDFVLKRLSGNPTDGASELLCNIVSPTLYLLMATWVTARQYVGSAIECSFTADISHAVIQYGLSVCYQETMFVPPHLNNDRGRFPQSPELRAVWSNTFYQWVPSIFLAQALICCVPNVFWNNFYKLSGLNVKRLVVAAKSASNSDVTSRTAQLEQLSDELLSTLSGDVMTSKIRKWLEARWVSLVFLLAKLIQLAVLSAQLYFLERFLNSSGARGDGYKFVWETFRDKSSWNTTGLFPRYGWCQFEVRRVDRLNNSIVDTIITNTVVVERLFGFSLLWISFMQLLVGLNILFWLSKVFGSIHSHRIRRLLWRSAVLSKVPAEQDIDVAISVFLHSGLKPDGILLVNLIAQKSSYQTAVELAKLLWEQYWRKIEGERSGGQITPERAELSKTQLSNNSTTEINNV